MTRAGQPAPEAVEMAPPRTRPERAPTASWKSREDREIPTFPQAHHHVGFSTDRRTPTRRSAPRRLAVEERIVTEPRILD